MNLPAVLRSGRVTRWHAYPEIPAEPLSAHQWMTAVIIDWLWPRSSRHLLRAALLHDVGELFAGDVPYHAKRDNPELAAILAVIEARAMADMGIVLNLTDSEALMLKLADRLAAYLYVRSAAHGELALPKWQRDRAEIIGMAHALGVGGEVEGVI